MTAVASKQGLRAEGARRTAKAAQDTPLPEKGAQTRAEIDRAERTALNEAHAALLERDGFLKGVNGTTGTVHYAYMEKAYGRGDVYQPILQGRGSTARQRLSLHSGEEIQATPVTCKKCLVNVAQSIQDKAAGIEAAAEAAKAAPAKPARKRAPKAAPAPDIQEDQIRAAQAKKLAARKIEEAQEIEAAGTVTAGDTKAHRNAEKFAAAGWAVEVQADGEYAELIVTRGDESMHQAWVGGVYQPEAATYTIADRTVRTRNVAEAIRWAARSPEAAKAELTKVASNKAFVKKAPTEVKRGPLPFSADSTDLEIVKALAGKKVQWLNRLSNTEEEAHVSADPRMVQVTLHEAHGDRIVRTCSRVSGFRAFYLSAVMRVR